MFLIVAAMFLAALLDYVGGCLLVIVCERPVVNMVEEIREMFARLKFSEEESKKIFCHNMASSEVQGWEAWVVGKFLSKEKVNKNAMYMVFCSLSHTKE